MARNHTHAPQRRRRGKGEEGLILAMTALLAIPLVVFTAFAVDLGAWYAQGARMQRAADAAALAGVVWASDNANPNKYDTIARGVATRNGYTDGVNGVAVDVVKLSNNRIKVTIAADGTKYFAGVAMKEKQRLTRAATARFNVPVPLGSPRNFIGTGQLGSGPAGTISAPENITASINGYCTDKNQGDQKASRFVSTASCSGSGSNINSEYSDENYAYYIDLPAGRTYNTPVVIFDGNYQTEVIPGWRRDFNPGNQSQAPMYTTFTLYQADGTPLDDTDNPTMASVNGCTGGGSGTNGTKTFNPDIRDHNYDMIGITNFTPQTGWWRICTIPSSAPAGRYILRVQNTSPGTSGALQRRGSNNYAVMAVPGSNQLCDARTTATCPRVYAKDFLSIMAAVQGGTGRFFLAEIGPEHAGKTVTVRLWDPAEGGTSIAFERPTGSNSWTTQNVTWTTSNGSCAGSPTTAVASIPVNSCSLNGHTLTIQFTLPTTWNPPADNKWFRIAYAYGGEATDRTTWSIDVSGDPVALVE